MNIHWYKNVSQNIKKKENVYIYKDQKKYIILDDLKNKKDENQR